MPELPEVEVVRAGLASSVAGRTIGAVHVLHPRPVRYHLSGPDAFASDLVGRRVGVARRRGKYLWLPLDDTDALLVHLGMSGQFRIDDADAPLLPNTRVLFDFTDGGPQLRFVDQRMFGGLQLAPGGAELPRQIQHIALDPFDDGFDPDRVAASLRARRSTVKRALLDQTMVSGIGNIYADESLFAAGIDPRRKAADLTRDQMDRLLKALQDVLLLSISQCGSSIRDYKDANGNAGAFQNTFAVYGRGGQPCKKCGRPLEKAKVAGRGTVYCSQCQR